LSSTCFEQPSVDPQVDLYMQFYAIYSCIRISSLVDVRMCCSKHVEDNIILMKKVCMLLVLITYVYHNPRFKNRKPLNISPIHVSVSVRCVVFSFCLSTTVELY